MSDLSTPTPAPAGASSGDSDDSLEALRAKLKEQRAEQKACLAKHKKTTFLAVETARRGTTHLDLKRIHAALEDDSDDELEHESQD